MPKGNDLIYFASRHMPDEYEKHTKAIKGSPCEQIVWWTDKSGNMLERHVEYNHIPKEVSGITKSGQLVMYVRCAKCNEILVTGP